ncbi:ImmA/IrrE family metallo-endopeptidase [Paenibacillus thermotolerans]|uniref:ImmA/IrrE family metallo-endopeptidase n=1 Tax=Paenibacillus thermotolerans TaxID=3027807 RepID=UPI002367A6E7|nr:MULTISPECIES: ImmA/IrrE family metallo-endopeptidase [unclassified Paenibacillus]
MFKLTRPRFMFANRAAQAVLRELKNPHPPIPIENFIKARNWEIHLDELYGPDGFMIKVSNKRRSKFYIYLATDADLDSTYREETLQRRQYFTLAHELGHILLHGSQILNSHEDMMRIPDDVAGIMEVEAHWFASRVLMPNYVFRNLSDLIPEQLADKCNVNFTAASKRLEKLEPDIRRSLMTGIRLDKWPKSYANTEMASQPRGYYSERWESLEEAIDSSYLLYICTACGLLHNERLISGSGCEECGSRLLNFDGVYKQIPQPMGISKEVGKIAYQNY